MANIKDYLSQILKARYGKDVRQSIHDAIHQCYDDGKAGSIDLTAREQLVYKIGYPDYANEKTLLSITYDGSSNEITIEEDGFVYLWVNYENVEDATFGVFTAELLINEICVCEISSPLHEFGCYKSTGLYPVKAGDVIDVSTGNGVLCNFNFFPCVK